MFYHFSQNNSGGSFDYNEARGIGVNVIVEADSANEANSIAEGIGIYFDEDYRIDCDCCGTRWSPQSSYYDNGDSVPTVYGREVTPGEPFHKGDFGFKWTEGFDGFIHYKDGRVEGFGAETA